MRGEDPFSSEKSTPRFGSPPHARGRRTVAGDNREKVGITPACAGKTYTKIVKNENNMDHPRMRGEDPHAPITAAGMDGSPPHARGRLVAPHGSTVLEPDHPRMRGEDSVGNLRVDDPVGSPPHARGRRLFRGSLWSGFRITPACAGKTVFNVHYSFLSWDHPRMRGEDSRMSDSRDSRVRITPACAGKTD